MKCAKCGDALLDEAVACANCGQPVRSAYKVPPPRVTPAVARPAIPKAPPPKRAFGKPPAAGTIPNYIVPALASLCCCTPLGIVAVVYAAQVNTKLTMNDPDGARLASQRAKLWCIAAFLSGIVFQGIWFLSNGTFLFRAD
jgi:hypothetical protein